MSKELEIQNGNKLIAEFMGGKYCEYPDGYFPGEMGYNFKGKNPSWWNKDNLQYHTSWDWLMPVVEKIEKMVIKINITTNCIIIRVENERDTDIVVPYKANKQTKIEGVWLAVIEFITWHNTSLTPKSKEQ